MGKLALAAVLLASGLLLGFIYKNSRFAVPSPQYRVLEADGAFEVREYPPMILVSTSMPGTDTSEGSGFMRLFRYISGSNEADRKISMTTPVLTESVDGGQKMSFLVPDDVAAEGAPRPLASNVELGKLEGGRFAVYRYRGSWSRTKLEGALEKLDTWTRARGMTAIGEPIIANYDPPFMPSFLRRNEVFFRLAP